MTLHHTLLMRAAFGLLLATLGCTRSSAARPATATGVRVPVSPAALRLGGDSFAIRFIGMPEGSEVHEYVRTPSGYRYTTRFEIGPSFGRTATVDLDPALRVQQARSRTWLGERTGMSDVRYAGGRARGVARPLTASTPGQVAIDRELPSEAFDGLALYPMLLARSWAVGQVETLTLFDTDEGSVTRQTARAVREETLTIGGQAMRALRLELTTTQLHVTLWLSVARPHRLLKVASANGETTLIP